MIKEFWVVTRNNIDESTTLGDVCFKSTPQTIGLQFLGGLKPGEVVGFYETEREAAAEAKGMLKDVLISLEKKARAKAYLLSEILEQRRKGDTPDFRENPPRPKGAALWKKAAHESVAFQARVQAHLKKNPPRPKGAAYWKEAAHESARREADGPGEEDIIIDPAGVPHQGGKAIGVEEKDISLWMCQHGFFPDVWKQDDHGGVILLVKDMGTWVDARAYYHAKISEAK